MGRFYKTAKPQFVNDIIYQPPWQLMQQAAAMKQTQYDGALASTDALNGLLKINHIDDEVENQNVATEKELYESQIEEVTNEIKKTGDYRKLMPRIREIQKGIMQSREDGNIAKFEQSAATRDKYLGAISTAKKDGGDIAGANAAYKTYMDKWLSQGDRSLENTLSYEEIIGKPEELEAKNIVGMAKKVPAYENSTFAVDPRGGYIVTTNGQQEYVSKEQLLETVQPYVMSNPNLRPYLDQRQRFGLGEYFNEDGQMIAPYEVTYYDANGSAYSAEEAKSLPEDQQNGLRKNFDFANNSLGQAFKLGTSFEYNKDKSTSKLQVDQVRENALNRNEKAKDRNLKRELQKNKQNFDLAKEKREKDAKNKIETLQSVFTTKNSKKNNMFLMANSNKPEHRAAFKDAFTNIVKDLPDNLKAHSEELLKNIESKKISTVDQMAGFMFQKEYPTYEDYISKTGIDKKIGKVASMRAGSAMSHHNHKKQYEAMVEGSPNWYQSYGDKKVINKVSSMYESYDKYMEDNYNNSTITNNITSFLDWDKEGTVANRVSNSILNNIKKDIQGYSVVDPNTNRPIRDVEDAQDVINTIVGIKGVGEATGDFVGSIIGVNEEGEEFILGPKDIRTSWRAISKTTMSNIPSTDSNSIYFKEVERQGFKQDLKGMSITDENVVTGDSFQFLPEDITGIKNENGDNIYFIQKVPSLSGEPMYKINVKDPLTERYVSKGVLAEPKSEEETYNFLQGIKAQK